MWAILRDAVLTSWGLSHLCGFSVTVSWLRDVQWVWGNLLLLAETPHVWSQGQIQDSLFPTICVWCEAQGQGTILSLAEHLEPLSTSQHFQNSCRIRYLIKWIVTDYVLSSSYYLHAVCHLAISICSLFFFFGESRGTILLEFFERITSHKYEEFTHLWPILSIFHQKLLVWKTWWPTCISSWHIKKIHLCQIMIISLWWN